MALTKADSSGTPTTDSPWFWVLLFCVVGLLFLVIFSGQIGKRQARLERQYQARERVMEDAVSDPDRREYATPDNTLVTIWPLEVLLIGAAIGAAGMLWRQHQRRLDELPG